MVDALAEDCRKLFELFLNDYTADTEDGTDAASVHTKGEKRNYLQSESIPFAILVFFFSNSIYLCL